MGGGKRIHPQESLLACAGYLYGGGYHCKTIVGFMHHTVKYGPSISWKQLLVGIDNKPIYEKKLFLREISKVKDSMKEPCKFLCLKGFIELYKIQINPLKFCGLISALKCLYNKNFLNESTTVSVKPDSFLNSFLKSSKGNK